MKLMVSVNKGKELESAPVLTLRKGKGLNVMLDKGEEKKKKKTQHSGSLDLQNSDVKDKRSISGCKAHLVLLYFTDIICLLQIEGLW